MPVSCMAGCHCCEVCPLLHNADVNVCTMMFWPGSFGLILVNFKDPLFCAKWTVKFCTYYITGPALVSSSVFCVCRLYIYISWNLHLSVYFTIMDSIMAYPSEFRLWDIQGLQGVQDPLYFASWASVSEGFIIASFIFTINTNCGGFVFPLTRTDLEERLFPGALKLL